MASKQRKEALAALDRANKEYEEVCKALKDKYAELDKESDSAIELISDVETPVESIRRRPWSYKTVKMKIAVCKRKFIDSKELKRKERNNHNHRPCRWYAQAPLGHDPGRAYRLIERSANRADFPGVPLKGLIYLPSFTGLPVNGSIYSVILIWSAARSSCS